MRSHGENDRHPSPNEVRKIAAELERHGKIHEVHIYPDVGHRFMSASGRRSRPEVIEDAWSKLIHGFNKYVVSEAVSANR